MANENGFIGELRRQLQGTADEHLQAALNEGFGDAASICLGVISRKYDFLMQKIASGQRPSDEELAVLSSLHELKSEIDSELRAFGESMVND